MKAMLALNLLLVLLTLGCTGKKEPGEAGAAPAKSDGGIGEAVVDVVTRRDAVEAGKRAKAAIKAVEARRQRDFEEALGEDK